jgi:hypothetical protein
MTAVYSVIVGGIDVDDPDSSLGKSRLVLANHLDVDVRFSEARCAKALPQAFVAYKEGLQSHYLAEVHSVKVNKDWILHLYNNLAKPLCTVCACVSLLLSNQHELHELHE